MKYLGYYEQLSKETIEKYGDPTIYNKDPNIPLIHNPNYLKQQLQKTYDMVASWDENTFKDGK